MDITTWKKGVLTFSNDYKEAIITKDNKTIYNICISDDSYNVDILVHGKLILSFEDKMMDKYDLNHFIRTVKNRNYIFLNGDIVFRKIELKNKILTVKDREFFLSENFLTMDIETKDYGNAKIAVCISIYDGRILKSYYLSDFNDSSDMLKAAIEYVLSNKYEDNIIYIHNISNFDSVYLLKIMDSLKLELNLTIRDNKFINITVTHDKKK